MKYLLIILLTLVYFSNNLYAQNNFLTNLDTALELSTETKQDIVLIFSASWCGHCKNLKKDLPNIKGFDNKIICIVDFDSNKKLSRQFKIKNLPTSIMLSSQGIEKTRITGYDKDSYEVWLRVDKPK